MIHTNLEYSSIDLQVIQEISDEEIDEAIKNAFLICHLVGIESKFHFKGINIFDVDFNTISIDWRMSKKGFNLVVMQFKKLNQKNAFWLSKLADV
ncbi:hypothetical protein [Flavobacterium psychrophilum]|uniref:hypothetical protein n=1 Tax=Flavobacterium psychrophilum TaxID=96345 RepID=UPI00090AC3CF|nr:hypothetical protein [Flavobacterium psychrophilum]EKT2072598.1 hypothetical protein [Flavobacterium psychrophilum]EKT4492111.1 hypothetical protein [Flavobacterium psychrophilum]SHH93422.1 Hypothetical protein THC0290_1178 [Flavobacterium psychrophilum]